MPDEGAWEDRPDEALGKTGEDASCGGLVW